MRFSNLSKKMLLLQLLPKKHISRFDCRNLNYPYLKFVHPAQTYLRFSIDNAELKISLQVVTTLKQQKISKVKAQTRRQKLSVVCDFNQKILCALGQNILSIFYFVKTKKHKLIYILFFFYVIIYSVSDTLITMYDSYLFNNYFSLYKMNI